MPYKCVHCNDTYEDSAPEVVSGCKCKGKFFFYIKEEKLKEISESKEDKVPELSLEEKDQIEADVREISGLENKPEIPVFLDFESVRVLKPGKYLLDIDKLFNNKQPKVYQLENGKYIVDLSPGDNSNATI